MPREGSEAGSDDDVGRTRELVERYKQGDQRALDELFERYYDRVHRTVRVRLGAKIRRRMDSEDVVQEVFADAARAIDRFEMRENASLVRWLATLAENRIRTAAKGLRSQKHDPSREIPIEGPRGPVEAKDESRMRPERLARRRERERVVDECVAELSADWRDVLLLRDYEGWSWRAVAEEMGRTEAAVQMLHKRAREALQLGLARRGVVDPSD